MLHELKDIEQRSFVTARRTMLSFTSMFITQFLLIQYGTYISFSWDIMEPITCGMTLGDAVLAYLFWIWSKRPYSI
jgi:hypothetical protein